MRRLSILSAIVFPLLILAAVMGTMHTLVSPATPSTAFTVNSTTDATDANPGDGVCETAAGNSTCSLRAAIQESNALAGADVVLLGSDIYTLTIAGQDEDAGATGDLDIRDNLTIQGVSTEDSIIDGGFLDRVIHITGTNTLSVTVKDVTIQNGELDDNATNGYGGGLFNAATDSHVIIADCIVRDNLGYGRFVGGGGGIHNVGTMQISSSSILSNQSNHGHGIQNRGTLTVTNSLVAFNSTLSGGGGAIDNRNVLYVYNTILHNNYSYFGAGVANGNGAPAGAGSTAILDHVHIVNNSSYLEGGGIINWAIMTITHSIIATNTVGTANGGGIDQVNGYLFLQDSVLHNNRSQNTIFQGAGGGLYVANNSTVSISNTAIISNSAIHGAGLYNTNGVIEIVNTTFSKNNSTNDGGGIWNDGIIALTNNTVVSNTAGNGSGLYNSNMLNLTNSIIANNQGSNNCSGPVPNNLNSQGYNLSSDTSCNLTATGDLTNTNPFLGPLQDNGGDTFTHALLSGSPAIDAGNNSPCPSTDQRGGIRPVDGNNDNIDVCDIGAYEFGGLSLAAVNDQATTPTNRAVLIDVLANDIPGDAFMLNLSAVGTPLSGTAVITDLLVLYTPSLDFTGTDVFTYTITDGVIDDTATVTVTVDWLRNFLPVITKND